MVRLPAEPAARMEIAAERDGGDPRDDDGRAPCAGDAPSWVATSEEGHEGDALTQE